MKKITPFIGQRASKYNRARTIVKDSIAFWYDTTNKSGKDIIDPMSAWFASFPEGEIQDNDKNKVNKLELAMHPDKNLVKDQM